jgi:hypothetical protein
MTDRTAELRELANRVQECDVVDDAWVAKSFTDQLFVVDLAEGEQLPAAVTEQLAEYGLRGANEVYGTDAPDTSFMGTLDDGSRHQFVDTQTRGDHQSYVLD